MSTPANCPGVLRINTPMSLEAGAATCPAGSPIRSEMSLEAWLKAGGTPYLPNPRDGL